MSTTDAQRSNKPRAWLGMLTLSVAALPACGGGSTPLDTTSGPAVTQHPVEAPRCETPEYPLTLDSVDTTSPTTLKACLIEGMIPVREELTGAPICEHLDHPCQGTGGEACTHECTRDSDCPEGSLCVCAAGIVTDDGGRVGGTSWGPNRCIPAACTSAADCGGWACGVSHGDCGWASGFYCYSSRDECSSDMDCDNQACRFSEDRWKCESRITCE